MTTKKLVILSQNRLIWLNILQKLSENTVLVVRIGGNVLAREQRPVQDLPKATVALVGVHSHWKGDSHCANKTHLAQEAGERAKHKSTTADTVEAFGE
jgi:hypothetical protein